jgi:hypothetical protein
MNSSPLLTRSNTYAVRVIFRSRIRFSLKVADWQMINAGTVSLMAESI